jgi:hypothetical protein
MDAKLRNYLQKSEIKFSGSWIVIDGE